MNVMLRSAIAAASLAASFAAFATDDGRHGDRRFDHRPPAVQHGAYGHGDIDARQARQEWRIRDAWHRGDLTRREFRILRTQQHDIERYESWAKQDGRIGPREHRKLNEMLDRADHSIRQFARNDVDQRRR